MPVSDVYNHPEEAVHLPIKILINFSAKRLTEVSHSHISAAAVAAVSALALIAAANQRQFSFSRPPRTAYVS